MPGASLWRDGKSFVVVSECARDVPGAKPRSVACDKLLQSSEKAQLQWKLEGEFAAVRTAAAMAGRRSESSSRDAIDARRPKTASAEVNWGGVWTSQRALGIRRSRCSNRLGRRLLVKIFRRSAATPSTTCYATS